MHRAPVVRHPIQSGSIAPAEKYEHFLKFHDINTDQLEQVIKEYLTSYNVEVRVNDHAMTDKEVIEMAKEQMVRRLAEDLLSSKVFDVQFKIDSDRYLYTGEKTVSCKLEIFDFNKYNRVFRPERCI